MRQRRSERCCSADGLQTPAARMSRPTILLRQGCDGTMQMADDVVGATCCDIRIGRNRSNTNAGRGAERPGSRRLLNRLAENLSHDTLPASTSGSRAARILHFRGCGACSQSVELLEQRLRRTGLFISSLARFAVVTLRQISHRSGEVGLRAAMSVNFNSRRTPRFPADNRRRGWLEW